MATRKKPAAKKKPPARKATTPKKRGRPSKKNPEVCAEICKRLSEGEPLAVICRDDHMPHDSTVRDWADGDEDFSHAIARAREIGFDVIAAGCLEIADDARNDWMEVRGKDDAGWTANGEHIQRSRLRIDTRLKLLAKWDPKRYGEKLGIGQADGLDTLVLVKDFTGKG